jgi:hypothetical protein
MAHIHTCTHARIHTCMHAWHLHMHAYIHTYSIAIRV